MKRCAALFLCLALGTPAALAGFFNDLYRGIGYAARPSGSPVFQTGDGGLVNGARNGRVRIVPDAVGRGYTMEFDRTFGADSRGRPEVLDLGPIEVQLNGATQATMGFTRRGFLILNADMSANNLTYAIRGKTGAQDAELTGTLNVANAIEINQFGFYTANINVNNTNSQLRLDGVVVRDEQNTNYSVGPIQVEGNIFFDLIVAGLASAGVDTTQLEALSPKSAIGEIVDSIRRQAGLDTVVAGDFFRNDLPLRALDTFRDPSLGEALLADAVSAHNASPAAAPSGNPIPEPAALALLLAGALLRRR